MWLSIFSFASFISSGDRETHKNIANANKFVIKEWKLFKCRLRNVNTIYQDFLTEIIILSIYEIILLSPHFFSHSQRAQRKAGKRKRKRKTTEMKEGHEMEKNYHHFDYS